MMRHILLLQSAMNRAGRLSIADPLKASLSMEIAMRPVAAKDHEYPILKREVDEIKQRAFAALMGDLYTKLSGLDNTNPVTLRLALNTLIDNGFDQDTLGSVVGTNRTQIARWARGAHCPKNAGFRAWLVGQLLTFMKDQVERYSAPPRAAMMPIRRTKEPSPIPAPV